MSYLSYPTNGSALGQSVRAIALYDYQANDTDEISFDPKDVTKIDDAIEWASNSIINGYLKFFIFSKFFSINRIKWLFRIIWKKKICAGVCPREQFFTGETFKSCAFYFIYNN